MTFELLQFLYFCLAFSLFCFFCLSVVRFFKRKR